MTTASIWTRYVTAVFGIWLILLPLTFTTHDDLMFWNDIITGIILTGLSLFSLRSEWLWVPWAICLLGIWLEMAPLIFWAHDAFTYLNDTLIGVFTIIFSILIPGSPGERFIMVSKGPWDGLIILHHGYNVSLLFFLVWLVGLLLVIWLLINWDI